MMRLFLVRLATAAALLVAVFACSDKTAGTGAAASGSSGGDSGAIPAPTGTTPSGSSGSPDSSPPPPEVNVTTETMEFGGLTRKYLLAKPADYAASKKYPLVMSFHGNPATAEDQANGIPFHPASKNEAIIVYPQALNNAWDLYTPTETNADMYWIEALPAEIAKKVNIDRSRIYGFGYSGGGFFLPQFTCRFGGVFKAISVNAGGGPDEALMGYGTHPNGCYVCPGGPVAIIVTHGAEDPEVVPASGDFTKTCYSTTNVCGTSTSPAAPAPCEAYDGCPTDKPVKWCLIPGLGHGVWPNAVAEAWAFFKSLP
jgi:polyhydroxybutyrate depolymerase